MSDTPTLDRFLSHALALIGGPGSGPLVTLGTLGPDGPRLRSVMLRRYTPAMAEAEIHTDRGSDKVVEIAADPRVSLHLWDAKALVQLRLSGRAQLIHADTTRWTEVPENSRISYGKAPPPGTPIDGPDAFALDTGVAHFTAVRIMLTRADVLHLDPDRHRRALYRRTEDGWHGHWVSP